MRVSVKNYGSLRGTMMGEVSDPRSTLETWRGRFIPWWISDGSALGLHRSGEFITWDTDIDVSIKAESGQKHLEIPEFNLIRTTDWGDRPTQTAFRDPKTDVIFDVYYYYSDILEGKLVTKSEGGLIVMENYKTLWKNTKYGVLPFPSPTEDYFVERYGDDWREPQKGKIGIYSNLDLQP